jgi:regulator of replication initiation timing
VLPKLTLIVIYNSLHLSCFPSQQECEELGRKVAELTTENNALRAELDNLKKACQDMEAENSRLMVSS